MYYSGWFVPFQTRFATTAAENGAVPLVQMNPVGVSIPAIAAGKYDGYLSAYAEAVRAYRHPVILSFGHEMNGTWYNWGYGKTSPTAFVAAWRHIVKLFRALGARNVTWLWTVNIVNDTQHGRIPRQLHWWPGSSYVNWVGIDGYYLKPNWQFAPLFGPTIERARTDRRPDTHCRDRRDACRRPAGEDRRRVRRHSRIRATRVRVVRRDELQGPGLRPQQSGGLRRIRQGCQHIHQARFMNGPPELVVRNWRNTAVRRLYGFG